MSSSTPNLNLTLPVGGENVSRHIINQNNEKIDSAFGRTMRDVPFAVAVGDWSASDNNFVATFNTAYVTSTSKDFLIYDETFGQYVKADMLAEKKSGGGGIKFTTSKKPTGTLTGTIYTIDVGDGKIPVIIENTVTPIANGGKGQSSLAGAKNVLGIETLENRVRTITSGSLKNIRTTGMYYLTGGVTDKPVANGGYYSVIAYNNDLLVGKYISTDGYEYEIIFINNTWYYKSNVNTIKSNSFMGADAKHFEISADSYSNNINTIVDYIFTQMSSGGFFSVDIQGSLNTPSTSANRNFAYGWLNGGNTYCWAMIHSFGKMYKCTRMGSSTFTCTEI